MKRLAMALAFGLVLAMPLSAMATLVQFDFETAWSGDYADGWENSAYRHGEAPVGKMMQQTTTAHGGASGMQLTAASTPEDWMWWAGVSVTDVNSTAMMKQYDPYISVWYYEQGTTTGNDSAGQLFCVPSWVNGYIDGVAGPDTEDWTDIQFGSRYNVENDFYHVAAGENMPSWQDTGVARVAGEWVNLKMQLSSADGYVHFYVDGVEVGQSYRNDYADLGPEMGLYTLFAAPLAEWGASQPYTIWDDFEFGSTYSVPEPGTLAVWSMLGVFGLALAWRRRREA